VSARAELDAAGVHDPALRSSYTRCRALNAEHGRTYYLATRLLPAAQRPAVHALYGFARWADEIVDDTSDQRPWPVRAAELDALETELRAGLAGTPCTHPVLVALVDTARRYDIPAQHFWDFLAAMQMDAVGSSTEVSEHASWASLMTYVHGSAAVIGLQVLPVLGTVVPREEAEPLAAALGVAFQLTNFVRDVGEDLDRGRVYLPADQLAAFGVDRELLEHGRATGTTDRRVRAALAHLVAHTRAVYRRAEPGIAMLSPTSRACVRAAFVLYGDILTEVEDVDYDVLGRRVVVPRRRRLAVAGPGLARTLVARARA
jgi:phytoene synthase